MKENGKKNMSFVIVTLILIGLIAAAYFYVTRDRSDEAALVTSSSKTSSTANLDKDFITALKDLKKIKLDSTIFDGIVWKSLNDFSRTLTPQDPGRPNPFAPLEGGIVGLFGTTSAQQ